MTRNTFSTTRYKVTVLLRDLLCDLDGKYLNVHLGNSRPKDSWSWAQGLEMRFTFLGSMSFGKVRASVKEEGEPVMNSSAWGCCNGT